MSYRKNLDLNIYSCMELSKQSYREIMNMPVKKMYDYLKWKEDYEKEKEKLMKENMNTKGMK